MNKQNSFTKTILLFAVALLAVVVVFRLVGSYFFNATASEITELGRACKQANVLLDANELRSMSSGEAEQQANKCRNITQAALVKRDRDSAIREAASE